MNKKILPLVIVIIGTISVGYYFFHSKQKSNLTHMSSSIQKNQETSPPNTTQNTPSGASSEATASGTQSDKEVSGTNTANRETSSTSNDKTAGKPTGSTTTPSVSTKTASQQPTCYRAIFTHAPIDSHQDGEACLHHKNQITLSQELVHQPSICVRVNGTPVSHKIMPGKKNSVVIGAVAGPHAEISVQYCTGKVVCNDPCKIPKDEFMSAIGGEDSDAAGGSWESGDAGPSADEKALQGELKNLNQETKGDSEQLSLFKGWNQKSESEFCQGNQRTKR